MSARRSRYAAVLAMFAVFASLALLAGVSGCSSDPNSVAAQAKQGDQKGYVSGNGAVEQIPAADRGEPVELEGRTLDGDPWTIDPTRGSVVVVNVWGSWCAPCVAEAPTLQQIWEQSQEDGKDVEFIGIDIREGPASGAAFASKVGMTYPSLTDKSGVLILNLQGKAPTVPTTLVLDREGRIAARVNGSVSAGVLTGLVDDALAET